MSVIAGVFSKIMSAVLAVVLGIMGTTTGVWKEQTKSLNTVQKLSETQYMMDYTYDYDLDTLLDSKSGNSTTLGLLIYALADVFLQANPQVKKLVASGELDFNFDAKQFSKIMKMLGVGINGFACTTFNSKTPDGDYILARNYDYMKSAGLTVWTHPKNGYSSVSDVSLYFLGYKDFGPDNLLTSVLTLLAPYLPVDGMNEKGLSIAVLELETDVTFQMTSKKDITTTAIIRHILDNCATVDEAIKVFKSYDMHDLLFGECTYHYQLADAKGNTAIIEYANGKTCVIRPDKKTKTLAATNFWLTEGVKDPNGLGKDRYKTAMDNLKKNNYTVSEKQAMDILKKVHVKDSDMNGYICSTLWSTVFNCTDKTFDLCPLYNYQKTYHFSVKKPLKYTVK